MLGFPNEETAVFIPNLKDFMSGDMENIEYRFLALYPNNFKPKQYFSENVKHYSYVSFW